MVSVWDAALQEVKTSDKADKITDRYILFAGASTSGKSSAILQFLARDEQTRPTIALEYTYARKPTNMQNKLTGHIWELGGGTHLTKLVQVPINADTLEQLTIVLVVDLSEPNKMWDNLEGLIKITRERVDAVIKQVNKRDPNFAKSLKKSTKHRLGVEKEKLELNDRNPFQIPLVIIGTKYDLFQDLDTTEKKLITGALRCLAYCHGATLLYTSSKLEMTSKTLRHVMNVAAFDGKLNKIPILEENKPVYAPAGSDSVEAIGQPPKAMSTVRTSNKYVSFSFVETYFRVRSYVELT